MADDFARSVQILIEIAGNPEARLTAVNQLVDQLNNKKLGLTDAFSGLTGGANNAVGALTKTAASTQDVARNVSDLSGKSVSAFSKIKDSVLDLNTGVQNLAASLAGIAMGGAVSGLAWKESADLKLLNEQIDKAIDANKKLGISSAELDEFVKGQVEAGEGTRQDTKQELYSVLMAGGKHFKGDSQAKLSQADAITDFWFSQQELMKSQGISSPEQLILRNVRTEGKMQGPSGDKLALAMGVDVNSKDFASAKNRLEYMIEQGGAVDMKVEMDKRPWEDMLVSVNTLKYAIGDGIAPAMSVFIKLLTGAVKLINSIPGAAPFIGLVGGTMAFASTLTLLNGVLAPGVAFMKSLVMWTSLHTASQFRDLVVSKARIVADWLGVTSLGARAVATTGLTAATFGLAAAEWAALSPLLLLAAPLIVAGGLLYLVESRTHAFSNALDILSQTEMSKDIIKWLEDVGYWAGYAIDRLGAVTSTSITAPIEGIDSLYKASKSGVGITGLLGMGGSGSENSSNHLLLTTKLFQPISLISEHTATVDETTSWIKGLLGAGWDAINGIYSGIINFPQNAFKFVVDGLIGIGKWIYNGIVYWATWIYNGIKYWGGEAQKAIGNAFEALGIDDQIDKFKTFVDDIKSRIGDLVSDFKAYVGGLGDKFTTTIQDLISKFMTFVTDIKNSISNLIPDWMKGGSDTGNAAAPTFAGFKEFVNTATKGSEGYRKYAQVSDEVLQAAYTEGQTGVPQPHPYMDEYEYRLIVSGYEDYEKTLQINNNTTNNNTTNNNIMNDFGAAAEKVQQDDIAKIKESAESGKPISSLTPDMGNPSGLGKIAYNVVDDASGGRISGAVDTAKEAAGSAWNSLKDTVGFADGGLVQKTGFALVHEGEPIIPAEVASSSRLQTILENIAYGGESSTSSITNNSPVIHVHYEVDPRRGILMDEVSFEHKVSDIIAKRLRQLNGF